MKATTDPSEHVDPVWIERSLASVPARAAADFRPVIDQLRSFTELAPGWDTYDAEVISLNAIRAAIDTVLALAGTTPRNERGEYVPDHLAPLADGGVQLEWDGPRGSLEVEFGPEGDVGYLLVDIAGAHRECEEATIADIAALVTEVNMPLPH